ncbi:aminotransferase class I/II-fold pyridoxal phosphate-dependent enzyme [Umezawaea endophytica]|uniref:Aminotransferase class I/II-fold pyridoxal phosphate-dependent enzyme n=1 Tax=Umezawaea endophytica TaxID=1654476 RepID=A0A9X2VTF0_9PSEU|nr:aminotransferase class I/II-fold pyridoxal phosphate-dependent enzyme [Umezawaea endophytica]MCS7481992.1 aminotransferase class I/II-fold pyridoxal phosphate-dependent enzyme [Umezawaea endophytica]
MNGDLSVPKIIHQLSLNENFAPPLPGVREAVIDAADHPHLTLDALAGGLTAALAVHLGVPASDVMVGAGSGAVLQQLLTGIAGPGAEVVHASPSFWGYGPLVRNTGATPIELPLEDGYGTDVDAMAAAVTSRTKAVLLCNPNNPTGAVLGHSEVRRLLDALPPDVLLIVDEAYREFCDPGEIADALALYREDPRVVVVRTFSKSHGLLGLRVGYLVAAEQVVTPLRGTAPFFRVSTVAQAAAIAALAAEEEMRARCAAVCAERERLRAALVDHGLSVPPSAGNYLWLPLGTEGRPLVEFLSGHGIAVSEVDGLGIRVTVGTREANDAVIALVAQYTRKGFSAAAEAVVARLREALHGEWPARHDPVLDIARYALLAPGKMLRPLLLTAAAGAVGGDVERVVPAALAVEYLHVGSLVHDDVIDDDETRRGRPSVQHRFGVSDAIVTGDALMLRTFGSVAESVERGVPEAAALEAVRAISDAGVDVCRGQALEGVMTADPSRPLSEHLEVMALKTGALFRGACRAGAVLGGAEPAAVDALGQFAEHLGLAFQMYDDLLPYLADPAVTGKSGLSDLRNQRPTYPVLLAHETGTAEQRARVVSALSGELAPDEAFATLRDVFDEAGVLKRGLEHAEAEIALAKSYLVDLLPNEYTAMLAEVADMSVDRRR